MLTATSRHRSYFLNTWPSLCWLAFLDEECVGAIVSKQEMHNELSRGYIAMLVVKKKYRQRGLGAPRRRLA